MLIPAPQGGKIIVKDKLFPLRKEFVLIGAPYIKINKIMLTNIIPQLWYNISRFIKQVKYVQSQNLCS